MRRYPRHRRVLPIRMLLFTGLGAGLGLCLSAPPSALAVEPDALQSHLTPRDGATGPDLPGAVEAAEPAWMPPEAVERERSSTAMEVGQAYVSDNLGAWLDDTPLAAVERLRRTDLVVAGGADDGPEGGLDVRLRVAERVRLTVARDDFRRDLVYDPLRNRMSMDLYRADLKGKRTGLALTDTYEVDEDAHRVLLNLRHRIE